MISLQHSVCNHSVVCNTNSYTLNGLRSTIFSENIETSVSAMELTEAEQMPSRQLTAMATELNIFSNLPSLIRQSILLFLNPLS